MTRLGYLALSDGQKLTFLSASNLVSYSVMCEITGLRDKRNFRRTRKLYKVLISSDIKKLQNPEPADIV